MKDAIIMEVDQQLFYCDLITTIEFVVNPFWLLIFCPDNRVPGGSVQTENIDILK